MKRFLGFLVLILFTFSFLNCHNNRSNTPKEKKSKENTIKGLVIDVQFIPGGTSSDSFTLVKFKDGKVKTFMGISHETFHIGATQEINWDSNYKIIKVETISFYHKLK